MMNRVGMIERLGPQRSIPGLGKLFGQELVGEFPARARCLLVDDLEMAELMEEYVIEHESTDRQGWPLAAPDRPEFAGRLSSTESPGQADPEGDGAEGDFPPPSSHIPEFAGIPVVVEMDRPQAAPEFSRESSKKDRYIRGSDHMPAMDRGRAV